MTATGGNDPKGCMDAFKSYLAKKKADSQKHPKQAPQKKAPNP